MKFTQKIKEITVVIKNKLSLFLEKIHLNIPNLVPRIHSEEEGEKFSGKQVSFINPSVSFKGEFSGRRSFYVNGSIKGKVMLEEQIVVIEPQGKVKADIKAKRIRIKGNVSGTMIATESISIDKMGFLKGDIFTPQLSISQGAHFEGRVKMKVPSDQIKPYKIKKGKKKKEKTRKQIGEKKRREIEIAK